MPLLTLSSFVHLFPCHLITLSALSPSYLFILSLCHLVVLVTLSPFHLVTLSPCHLVPCHLSHCPQMLTLSSWKSLSLAKESSRTQEEVVVATDTWEPNFRGNLFQVTLELWQLSFKFQRILSVSFSFVQNLSVVGHT